jgi:subtilisin family serine protease
VVGVYNDYEIQLNYTIQPESKESSAAQVEDCAVTSSGGHGDGSSKYTWIWILDSGIDTDHPDLDVQAHAPYAASFVDQSVEDLNGHGTHVAGIAAAKDNGIGVVGISAGAKVVPVKVANDVGTINYSWAIAGLNHVAQYSIPGDVVNMSFGGFQPDCGTISFPGLQEALINLANAGVWMCIAAGNSNDDASFYFPACINNKRVFTVAAVGCGQSCASFSNLGINVDWYAVGVDVYSTYLNDGYATLSGTSMATPVVAGIIHSRGQAPLKGPNITCEITPPSNPDTKINLTKPLAIRQ